MKRTLAILLIAVMMLTLFAACSKAPSSAGKNNTTGEPTQAADTGNDDKDDGPKLTKDQKAILKDLEKEFSIDGYEKEIAAEVKADEETAELVDLLGIDVDDYVSGLMKHYNWTFGDIDVEGDTAVANVTMTYPDFDAMSDMLTEKAEAWVQEKGGMDNVTEDEFYAAYGKMVVDILNDDEFPTLDSDFTIDYIKDGKDWVIKDKDAVKDTMNDAQDAA